MTSANDSDGMEVARYLTTMKHNQDEDSSTSSGSDEVVGRVKVAPAYHLIPIKTAVATPQVATATQRLEHKLTITSTLPHIHLPIGDGRHERKASVSASVDSGAGLNLGRLQYHEDVAR